jgi:hypothetical protein
MQRPPGRRRRRTDRQTGRQAGRQKPLTATDDVCGVRRRQRTSANVSTQPDVSLPRRGVGHLDGQRGPEVRVQLQRRRKRNRGRRRGGDASATWRLFRRSPNSIAETMQIDPWAGREDTYSEQSESNDSWFSLGRGGEGRGRGPTEGVG